MSSRSRRALLGTLVLALSLVVPSASAQLDANASVTAEEFSGEAMPMGAPATTNFTISYTCGGYSGSVAVTVEADANVSGADASVDPGSFDAVSPPSCNAGQTVETDPFTLTVTAGPEALAGTQVPVTIKVAGKNVLTQDQEDAEGNVVAATVGPYVDISFTPKTDAFEVPAGEAALVVIDIVSNSNTMVMAMPTLTDRPEGWPKPDIFPMNIESPLVEGANGTSAFEFEVRVPADAEPGEYVLNLELFAHSMTDTYVESETTTIPLTFTVTPGAGDPAGDGDAEESPLLSPVPLALLAVGLLALLRRRV